jgi:[ribosomal protein S5]-alanine N-acetyltransferase
MSIDNVYEDFPRLETKRLVLEEIIPGDAEAILRILGDEAVMRYYDVPAFTRIEEAHQIIARVRSRFEHGEGIRWGISIKGEDVVIGTCGYTWHMRHLFGEIGYDLARAYWRQGIMKEALEALLHFGFEQRQLHRVEAKVRLGNQASMGALQKLGFQEEGILRERIYVNDQFYDVKMYSLLRREYINR